MAYSLMTRSASAPILNVPFSFLDRDAPWQLQPPVASFNFVNGAQMLLGLCPSPRLPLMASASPGVGEGPHRSAAVRTGADVAPNQSQEWRTGTPQGNGYGAMRRIHSDPEIRPKVATSRLVRAQSKEDFVGSDTKTRPSNFKAHMCMPEGASSSPRKSSAPSSSGLPSHKPTDASMSSMGSSGCGVEQGPLAYPHKGAQSLSVSRGVPAASLEELRMGLLGGIGEEDDACDFLSCIPLAEKNTPSPLPYWTRHGGHPEAPPWGAYSGVNGENGLLHELDRACTPAEAIPEDMRPFEADVDVFTECSTATTESYYQRALQTDADNGLILRNYARFLVQAKGDYAGAEKYLEKAVLACPGDADVLVQYAKLLWDFRHDAERATDYFERAAQVAPEDCYVLAAYASFLWSMEATMAAAKAAETLAVTPPSNCFSPAPV